MKLFFAALYVVGSISSLYMMATHQDHERTFYYVGFFGFLALANLELIKADIEELKKRS